MCKDVFVANDRGDIRAYGNPYAAVQSLEANAYRDVRPGYPNEALQWALAQLHKAGSESQYLKVADIGAGTGKLTAQLVALGYDTWAVEPAAQMRTQFTQALPDFPPDHLLATSGEATGLPDRSCAAVVYGQSWHWLDAPAASAEAARILRSGGVLAVLVNQLAVDHPWVHRLTRIMRSGDVAKLSNSPQLGVAFSDPESFSCEWSAGATPEEIIALGATRASWLRASAGQRVKMRANLEWYLYEHLGFTPGALVQLPYRTYAWRAYLR